jgi:hypothetical protein
MPWLYSGIDGGTLPQYATLRCRDLPPAILLKLSPPMPEQDKVLIFGILIMLLALLALWFPSGPRGAGGRR